MALRSAAAASATPYGYTLTIWTSGAVLSHSRGIPSAVDALLFMVGAVSGFAAIAISSHGGIRGRLQVGEMNVAVWHGFHFASIGAAIGAAALIARAVHGWVAWPADGFVATTVYLLVVALLLTLAAPRR